MDTKLMLFDVDTLPDGHEDTKIDILEAQIAELKRFAIHRCNLVIGYIENDNSVDLLDNMLPVQFCGENTLAVNFSPDPNEMWTLGMLLSKIDTLEDKLEAI